MDASPPQWAILLEIAHGDPLRAQQLEHELSGEWWTRYHAWAEEKAAYKENRAR